VKAIGGLALDLLRGLVGTAMIAAMMLIVPPLVLGFVMGPSLLFLWSLMQINTPTWLAVAASVLSWILWGAMLERVLSRAKDKRSLKKATQ
jgi:hypothetical protein